MAEKRAIDAVELAKEISSLRVSVTGLRAGKGVLSAYAKEFKESVLKIIDEAETLLLESEDTEKSLSESKVRDHNAGG